MSNPFTIHFPMCPVRRIVFAPIFFMGEYVLPMRRTCGQYVATAF